MLIEIDKLLFIIAGFSLLIALLMFLFYFKTRPKTKMISFEKVTNDSTSTLRHSATVHEGAEPLENEHLTVFHKQDEIDKTELLDDATELLGDATELCGIPNTARMTDDDTSGPYIGKIIGGVYRIDRGLGKGGMSSVYLCTNLKIGNKWAVKYISNENNVLAEQEILKQLNHTNLPKIIDIFNDNSGIYIVESYIEGVGLEKIIERNEIFEEEDVTDIALQLSDVLSYLHNIKPAPIIHRDLKPSNIIITDDGKLVLIDFGISKQNEDTNDTVVAVSKNYAAPEQFVGKSDERSDIFSYGVILYQLATRHLPNMPGFDALLKDSISIEIAQIILKCIEANPDDRYQNVSELRNDLARLKFARIKNIKRAFGRKLIAGIASFFVVVSGVLGMCGVYKYNQLNEQVISVNPEVLFLSEQERNDFYIEALLADGNKAAFDSRFVTWQYSDINVARIEANEIIGMNVGTTEIKGVYRNKAVNLLVNVVKPDGMTNIRLKYNSNFDVASFAGTGERDIADGTVKNCSMVNPTSIDVAPDGSIYFVDSGYLRQIVDGEVATIEFEPSYITPKEVKAVSSGEMWFLTDEWQDEDGFFRGIVRVTDKYGLEGVYIVRAGYSDLLDITSNSKGEIIFLEKDLVNNYCFVKKFGQDVYEEPKIIAKVPATAQSIAFDNNDVMYIADTDLGLIYKYNEKTEACEYFVGVIGDKNFIDGVNARLYMPYKIKVFGDYLYVLDYNVLRRICISSDEAFDVETVAGKPGFASDGDLLNGKGYEVFFEKDRSRDITIGADGVILMTDSDNSIIRKIEYTPAPGGKEPHGATV